MLSALSVTLCWSRSKEILKECAMLSALRVLLELCICVCRLCWAWLKWLASWVITPPRKALTGKVVLITGAAGGIGRALARRFALHGCLLALVDINKVSGTDMTCRPGGHYWNNIKEYEHSRFIEKWKQDIKDSVAHPILHTYKLYKKEFQFEAYLMELHNIDPRKAIVRFRLSSHSLRLETGRYLKPKLDVQKRICIYCDKGEVDDEIHLITPCTFHGEYRTILLDYVSKFGHEPSMLSETKLFFVIMSTKCHDVILRLGKFLRFCFHDRNTVTQTDRA